MKAPFPLESRRGQPYPFGASILDGGINFALACEDASSVTLCFFNQDTFQPAGEIHLLPEANKTGNVWHVLVVGLNPPLLYAYRITNPFSTLHESSERPLLDPYAKEVGTSNQWLAHDTKDYLPLGELPTHHTFDWENDTPPDIPIHDLIIYEMHVRGFTQHTSSGAVNPGTFLGVIERIPHLLDLGINAVELLPIQEFDEREFFRLHPHAKKPYCNFWGYSTVNFFSPMKRYASVAAAGAATQEFKTMVKELHRHGIEVILDVVFNHTAEGNASGPILSFKGIDNSLYYLLSGQGAYSNYSGCGNTLNSNHPQVTEMIIDCLRYWTTEMHVDGFRFDLASALTRNSQGSPLAKAPLIQAITADPVLAQVKLIAEPWDAAGLYQVGSFAPGSRRWSEWNGKYRDAVRRFIRGDSGAKGEFATRLCGSEDLYRQRGTSSSINFVTAHDGFTLADLVAYNDKHNLLNKEHNRDGANDNESWNCGKEGPTTDPNILQLRLQQMRNFHLALLVSQGVPMLHMGDEYGHTKDGNNNTWCHDTTLNWFLWNQLKSNQDFYRFYRMLIAFRHRHPILRRRTFLTDAEIDWHSQVPFKPEWNGADPILAFTLKDPINQNDLYVAFNPSHEPQTLTLPPPSAAHEWHLLIDTAGTSPNEIYEEEMAPKLATETYLIPAHSALLLKAFQPAGVLP